MYSTTKIFILIMFFWLVISLVCSLYFMNEFIEYGERRFPHQIYKEWLEDKNLFGKVYTIIGILFAIPSGIIGVLFTGIIFLFMYLHELGKKKN